MAKKKKSHYRFSLSLFLLLLILATLAGALIFSTSIYRVIQQNIIPQASSGEKVIFNDGKFNPRDLKAIWLGKPIASLTQELKISPDIELLAASHVLGESTDEKWIEIDLASQMLRAHDGDQIVYEFPVSSGKFFHTPTGEFRIWYKVKYTKMEGGVKGTGTYYYLPNVPYTMFFYQGFGIHGTYWHNNFGHPMSHGCVNVSISDAEKLFYWADPVLEPGKSAVHFSAQNPGTKVVVHGETPRS